MGIDNVVQLRDARLALASTRRRQRQLNHSGLNVFGEKAPDLNKTNLFRLMDELAMLLGVDGAITPTKRCAGRKHQIGRRNV